jgi:hypothetical protein
MSTQKKRPPKASATAAKKDPAVGPDPATPPAPARRARTTKLALPANAVLKEQKLSALDAAAQVLRETGQALTCPELIAQMAAQGYWTSPNGQTPAATLSAAMAREIQAKGAAARFVKIGPGEFAIRVVGSSPT